MTFTELLTERNWKPIRNCPGRFVLVGSPPDLLPADLMKQNAESFEFAVEAARDLVVVVPFDDGGLISYKKPDGTYVHTLNNLEGFSRKLAQLGVTLPVWSIPAELRGL
jgi:hypothetical protein